jgi:hypothetical protein
MFKLSEDGKLETTWRTLCLLGSILVSAFGAWWDVSHSVHRLEHGMAQVITIDDMERHDMQMQILNHDTPIKYPDKSQYFHGAQWLAPSTTTQQER